MFAGTPARWRWFAFAVWAALGCQPLDSDDDGSEDAASDRGTSGSRGSTTTDASSSDGSTRDDDGSSSSSGAGGDEDTGEPEAVGECSTYIQDCALDRKCVPYATRSGAALDSTRCASGTPIPALVGETCGRIGLSGNDNCEGGSLCWNIDPETGAGVCVELCSGSRDEPICETPQTECAVTNDGVVAVCLPPCDPLVQDCAEGEACYFLGGAFACYPQDSASEGEFAEPCRSINACAPGLTCVRGDGVPGCTSNACCTPFCTVGSGDDCPGDGQTCAALFEEDAPSGAEDLGVCFSDADV